MVKQSTGGGYGKPPVKNRFKKGKSGNPKGRPKKKTDDSTDVLSIIEEPLTVKINGKTNQMSPFEIATRKLSQKAIRGDFPSISKFIQLCVEYSVITPLLNEDGGGVLTAPPGVDFHEWLKSVTEEVPIEE